MATRPYPAPSDLHLSFFFVNEPPTTGIYTVGNTLSLHDALPISGKFIAQRDPILPGMGCFADAGPVRSEEHTSELQSLPTISYAVFCLKKKKRRSAIASACYTHACYSTYNN